MREPSPNMRVTIKDGVALAVLAELGITPAQAAERSGIDIEHMRRICIPTIYPTTYSMVRPFLVYAGCSLARLTGDAGPDEDEFYLQEWEDSSHGKHS